MVEGVDVLAEGFGGVFAGEDAREGLDEGPPATQTPESSCMDDQTGGRSHGVEVTHGAAVASLALKTRPFARRTEASGGLFAQGDFYLVQIPGSSRGEDFVSVDAD